MECTFRHCFITFCLFLPRIIFSWLECWIIACIICYNPWKYPKLQQICIFCQNAFFFSFPFFFLFFFFVIWKGQHGKIIYVGLDTVFPFFCPKSISATDVDSDLAWKGRRKFYPLDATSISVPSQMSGGTENNPLHELIFTCIKMNSGKYNLCSAVVLLKNNSYWCTFSFYIILFAFLCTGRL